MTDNQDNYEPMTDEKIDKLWDDVAKDKVLDFADLVRAIERSLIDARIKNATKH